MSFLKSKHSGWTWDMKRTPFGGGKGGGGGSPAPAPAPTSQSVSNTSIPEYARPYVETMLGTAQQQIFNYDDAGNVTGMKPYVPYSNNAADYIAGFSPLQQQAQSNIANMQVPGQYNTAMNYAQTAGLGALGTANPAAQYGGMGANAGLAGMAQGMSYGQNATDPNAVAAYMNPYLQATLNPAMQLQAQQFGQLNAQNQGQATQQGAFGGGRQAVMQGLNQQNQMLAQNQLVGGAYNQAYNTANQNMQAAAQLGMQGTGQAMQGAGIGLQGVGAQQAAYGQLGNQAANLGNIAGQQTQNVLGINAAQQASGAAQQAQQQNIINQAVQNYGTQQQYPMTQLANMSALLRGMPMQQTTVQSYQAAPSAISTLGGLGATAIGAYGASGGFKSAKGGVIKEYAAGGQVAFDVGGSVEADLRDMDIEGLKQQAENSPSAMIRQEARQILIEKMAEQQAMQQGVGAAAPTFQAAGGGIVAFAGEESSLVEEGGKKLSKETKEYLASKAGKDTVKTATTTAAETAAPGFIKRLGLGLGAYELADTGMGFSEGAASALAGPEQSSRREMMMGAGGGDDTAIAASILDNADYSKPVPSWIPDWLNPNKMTSPTTPTTKGSGPAFDPTAGGNPAVTNLNKPSGILGADTNKPSAEDKDYQMQVGKIGTQIDKLTAELNKGLSSGKSQSDLNDLREEIKDKQDQKFWLSLMAGGAKAMASTSPFANVGIGQGVGAGVETYAQAAKAEREDKKLLIAQQSALEQAEYARKTGNLNALIAAQTRLDQIKAHRDTLKAQYAGISASKEATLEASKTKAYGDTILKAIASGMSEDEATSLANRIYSGKGTAPPEGVKVTKLKG